MADTLVNILSSFLMQLIFTVGIIWLFGFLISLCNKIFYQSFGRAGRTMCYITGFIGTPIHECSHALFCLIFGHKIVDMQLFQIDDDEGTLGYVRHTYNPKNVYHLIGNFFIGIAPIVVITAILSLLSHLLVPDMLSDVVSHVTQINGESGFSDIISSLFKICTSIFSHIGNYKLWIFFGIGVFLCLHMTLSWADIRSALSSVGILLGALLVVDLIVGFISKGALSAVTSAIVTFGGYIASFLTLGLIVSLVAMLISLIFRVILR